jgi:hypothetical protein
MNSSSNSSQWILFNQMNKYENIWFFGLIDFIFVLMILLIIF